MQPEPTELKTTALASKGSPQLVAKTSRTCARLCWLWSGYLTSSAPRGIVGNDAFPPVRQTGWRLQPVCSVGSTDSGQPSEHADEPLLEWLFSSGATGSFESGIFVPVEPNSNSAIKLAWFDSDSDEITDEHSDSGSHGQNYGQAEDPEWPKWLSSSNETSSFRNGRYVATEAIARRTGT